MISIQKARFLLMADISGHIKSGPVMELLTGSRCCALRLASLVIDSYCEDNERFHWILVAADNTWQIIKCQEREQVLYKQANSVYYIGSHMKNASVKTECQFTSVKT